MNRKIAISLLLFLPILVFGQTPMVGIGPAGISGVPDEAYVNQSVNFSVSIQNKGVVNIYGQIDVFAGTLQGQQVMLIGAESIVVDSLLSGETTTADLSFPVDTSIQQLAMGGNTVVVWPAISGTGTTDSIYKEMTIILPPDTIGINFSEPVEFPDSVEYGVTDSIIFYVENRRKSPFTGTINLTQMIIPDSTGNISTRVDSTTLENIVLDAEESRRVAMVQTFENPQYRVGGNTVVVWPSQINMETADTATGRVEIIVINSIKGIVNPVAEVKVFPNPSKDKITIQAPVDLEQVIIYDNRGAEVMLTTNNEVDISSLPKGNYVITVVFAKGGQNQYKLIKQ